MAQWEQNGNRLARLEFAGANVKVNLLGWQRAGLTWTATGYGDRIPTRYMVWTGKHWQRVYCRIFSNVGTCYIIRAGVRVVGDVDTEHADNQAREQAAAA